MEKVFIKPTAKEIMLKGNAKDGPSDLFSYDYADSSRRGLGHLYVVGNIQAGQAAAADDIDVGYVINLVASLAKREYYAKADAEPKEAFAAALKKINGVIEEFFKQKDTKINIGLFTIASGQVHIAKLGKFKILLARDGDNVDILNNIDLFKKESTQEKQFSNIISGSVADGDRILAFYPSRLMVAREKQLKANLLSLGQDEFAKELESIKDNKQDFACAAVHIELHKVTEAAIAQNIQPKEIPPEELAIVNVQLASEVKDEIKEEMPKIIPAEFSLGRQPRPFAKYAHQIKNMKITPNNRMFVMGGTAAAVLVAIVILKSYVFVNASDRALSAAAAQANSSIKVAETKVSQNDLLGAHSILLSSLASLNQSIQQNGSSDKVTDVKNSILQALDNLEQATDAELSAVATIPSDNGVGQLLTASGNDVYAYLLRGETGAIVKVSQNSISGGVEVKGISPTALFASETYVSAIDLPAKKAASLSLKKNTVGNMTFTGEPLVSADVYQDNLYGITANSIIKIADATSGHSAVTTWLASGATLAGDPRLVAVDGNVYVLSGDGVLTMYYKGQAKNGDGYKTAVVPDATSTILTTADSPSLYVVNKSLGRIYVIEKTTGDLTKTLKLNSNTAIISAALATDGTIYILSDNKIWKTK